MTAPPRIRHLPLAEATRGDEALDIAERCGLVADAAQQTMSGRYDNMVGFVAGPPIMVDGALRVLIREARLPPQFVRYDKFS